MERTRQFVSAIIAGMLIGMGGTVYLSQSNAVIGSFLFSIGLYTILVFQLHLYTGKIGYTPFQKPVYIIELLITWFGNLVGTGLVALMVSNTRIFAGIEAKVVQIAATKLGDGLLSIFILSWQNIAENIFNKISITIFIYIVNCRSSLNGSQRQIPFSVLSSPYT